jgi:hypothetical protein
MARALPRVGETGRKPMDYLKNMSQREWTIVAVAFVLGAIIF